MKSGPTLNGCTESPRRRKAPISPRVTLVFPTPLCVPAMTTALSPGSMSCHATAARYSPCMRIVSLLPSATDMIAELGLLDSLVGISEDCNWPAAAAGLPHVARTRIEVGELSAAQIDALVNDSVSDGHSLYAVDA